MRKSIAFTLSIALLLLAAVGSAAAAPREVVDLSGPGWKLWLDRTAPWRDDPLLLPPVDVAKLPVRPPTAGWDALTAKGRDVAIPGTVEQYTWDQIGDYQGVSWWARTIELPDAKLAGRQALLRFEAVRLRAEVFLNGELVAYDAIGNTPFEVDVTGRLHAGQPNTLAVRVTDPPGRFDWQDFEPDHWGKQDIPPSHGFGGVTGPVRLVLVDPTYIDDVFVKNKPAITEVDVEVTLKNVTAAAVERVLDVTLLDAQGAKLAIGTQPVHLPPGATTVTCPDLKAPQAQLWSVETPHLYTCRVSLREGDRAADALDTPFGFRWFTLDGVGQDAKLRLNGKRIVLRSAMSWGFWPVNGITPTPTLARRQIEDAKRLGMNMLNFHRSIGQPLVLNLADELGLLYFEEPGGYECRGSTNALCFALVREKWLRMVRRDRSHPSLIIYNMMNEAGTPPERAYRDMADAHKLDPTRLMTWTSGWAQAILRDPVKLHMRPYDDTQYIVGWHDSHNALGPGVYMDEFYQGPKEYLRRDENRAEGMFWGEEGAIGTPPRLAKIVAELGTDPNNNGWDGARYRAWAKGYDKFLDEKKLRPFFPTLDALTESIGDVAYYYQGRAIENVRMGDVTDGYVTNGWEAEIIENHSGMVDCFRNFKGHPEVLARYNRPCYVAVKLRTKVGQVPLDTVVDFYMINEVNLHGAYKLVAEAVDPNGKAVWNHDYDVKLTGGDVYGELIQADVTIPLNAGPGRYTVRARLEAAGDSPAPPADSKGEDEAFLVDWRSAPVSAHGAVLENGTVLRDFLKRTKDLTVPTFTVELPKLDYVVVGDIDPSPRHTIPADVLTDPNGQPGLRGEYFKGTNFETPVLQRIDAGVNFDFTGAGPAPEVGGERFSVRWTGHLKAPETGKYVLVVASDDGVRLWLDNKVLVDEWHDQAPRPHAGPAVQLEQGHEYALRLEYFQNGGPAQIRLFWISPSADAEGKKLIQDLLRRVSEDGTTAIFLDHAEQWAARLATDHVLQYHGTMEEETVWMGGNTFVRAHPLVAGLPVNGAMNWEYQSLVNYGVQRYGLFLDGEEVIAAGISHHEPRVVTSLGVVPHGRGRIVLSTLPIMQALSLPADPAAKLPPGPLDVPRKLFVNYLQYAATPP